LIAHVTHNNDYNMANTCSHDSRTIIVELERNSIDQHDIHDVGLERNKMEIIEHLEATLGYLQGSTNDNEELDGEGAQEMLAIYIFFHTRRCPTTVGRNR